MNKSFFQIIALYDIIHFKGLTNQCLTVTLKLLSGSMILSKITQEIRMISYYCRTHNVSICLYIAYN